MVNYSLCTFLAFAAEAFHTSRGSDGVSSLLNIGIIGACFGIFVSLSDFFLKPAQKKRIDEFIDSITLRLSYTNTLDWLQRWLTTAVRAQLVRRSVAVLNIVAGVAFASVFAYAAEDQWGFAILLFVGHALLWFWVTRAVIKKVYKWFALEIVRWLATRSSYKELVIGYLKVIAYGGGVIAFLATGIYGFKGHQGNLLDQYYGIGPSGYFIALLFPLLTALLLCWFGLFIDGVVTLVGATLTLMLRKLVDLARWIMWKISDYPKGPLTATLTLIGAVFAVIKMLMTK